MKHDEMVSEIGRLSEMTANLKKQLDQPKNRLDRFKEYAGFISLVLSVATGCFAVYTTLVTEPQKSKAEDQAKLYETLAQIVSLDQEYLKELLREIPMRTTALWNPSAISCCSKRKTWLTREPSPRSTIRLTSATPTNSAADTI